MQMGCQFVPPALFVKIYVSVYDTLQSLLLVITSCSWFPLVLFVISFSSALTVY